jgi:hypothetical protein
MNLASSPFPYAPTQRAEGYAPTGDTPVAS